MRRADGLLVESHGIQVSAFDPRDLCANQCSAIFEILTTILRPKRELFIMFSQSFEMLALLFGHRGIAGRRAGKCTIGVTGGTLR
jgi:hypothetical protein